MSTRKQKPSPTPAGAARSNDEVNKYGVALSVWSCLTIKQRQTYYSRFYQQKHNPPSGPTAWAKLSPEKKIRNYELAKLRRRANLDEELRKEREYYRANVERMRAQWQASYWRNRPAQLARSRRRTARQRSQRQITLSPDAVFRMIDKAVSKMLPSFVRDDVIAAMCLAVLEGTLFVENIPKEAAKFLSAHNREYDHFKTVSLDAPINGCEGITLLDRLVDQRSPGDYSENCDG